MTQPYRFSFMILGLPKLVNGGWGKSHWAVQSRERRYWRSAVAVCMIGHKPPVPLKRAHLTLTRFSASAPDSDNLAASFKSVVDGLVDAGVLENDRYENIGMPSYQWAPAKRGDGHITVEVVEIREDDIPNAALAQFGRILEES